MKNEVLPQVKEEHNILRSIKPRKVNWNYHILRGCCLLKHVIEGRIERVRRRRRRHKQLLEDLKVNLRYWNRKAEALDRSRWRTGFGKAVDLAEDSLVIGGDGDARLHIALDSCSYTFPYATCLKWNPYKCGGIQRRLVQSGYSRVFVFTREGSLTKHGNTLL